MSRGHAIYSCVTWLLTASCHAGHVACVCHSEISYLATWLINSSTNGRELYHITSYHVKSRHITLCHVMSRRLSICVWRHVYMCVTSHVLVSFWLIDKTCTDVGLEVERSWVRNLTCVGLQLGLWIEWSNHRTMRSLNNMVCTTDSGVGTPSRLVEHGTQHDTIGSI